MAGGLLTLVGLASIDFLFGFKRGAIRNLSYLLVGSAACIVVSGLPGGGTRCGASDLGDSGRAHPPRGRVSLCGGPHHPRCFVVVIASGGRDVDIPTVLHRLRALIVRPLPVVGRDPTRHEFTPAVGIGIVTVHNPGRAIPLDVINEAERLAVGTEEASTHSDTEPPFSQDQIDTVW